MRALVWTQEGIAAVQVSEPAPGPAEVAVAVHTIGICGSDISSYRGELAHPAGEVPGHEMSGIVVELGEGADPALLGRRVTVNAVLSCGLCWACRSGADNLCPQVRLVGVHAPGGFAERIVVPAVNVAVVPDSMPYERAASAEPFAQAAHDVRLAREVVDAETALVIGAGSVGLLLVNAARLSGIREVHVIEPMTERHGIAAAAGASRVVARAAELDSSGLDRGGYDAVFDVVGIATTRRQAVDLARKGGVVLMVGLHADETEIPWRTVIRKELTIRGANAFSRLDFQTVVGWLEHEDVLLGDSPLFLPLDEGPAAFADISEGRNRASKTYLVVNP